MKLCFFWTLAFTLMFGTIHPCAFAQAAAESVLLNGSTSTATIKGGSSLGSVLNQGMQKISRQLSQPTSARPSPVRTRAVRAAAPRAASIPSSGSPAHGPMISSIQSSGSTCAFIKTAASAPDTKAAAEPERANCSGPDSSVQSTDKYKSVITVSMSK